MGNCRTISHMFYSLIYLMDEFSLKEMKTWGRSKISSYCLFVWWDSCSLLRLKSRLKSTHFFIYRWFNEVCFFLNSKIIKFSGTNFRGCSIFCKLRGTYFRDLWLKSRKLISQKFIPLNFLPLRQFWPQDCRTHNIIQTLLMQNNQTLSNIKCCNKKLRMRTMSDSYNPVPL